MHFVQANRAEYLVPRKIQWAVNRADIRSVGEAKPEVWTSLSMTTNNIYLPHKSVILIKAWYNENILYYET